MERANVHQADQSLHLSRIRLAYTVLRAPFDGVVLVRQAELGEVVLPGTPIVTLADLNHLWVRVYVPETGSRQGALGPGGRCAHRYLS